MQKKKTIDTKIEKAETTKDSKKTSKKRILKHKDVNNGKISFAAGLNFYKLVWIFAIGCVIGVVVETLFVYFTTGVWMRRSGMLYGPFNQIYGLGAVLFSVLLYRFRNKNAFIIFMASAVIGLLFEYICSWVQEIVFGSTSWNYEDIPTNIGGRINLFYGVGWGVLGLIFIMHFWPFMSELIERIPNTYGKILTIAVAVFLAVDLGLSAIAVVRQSQRVSGIPATNAVEKWLDATYPDEVMKEKYPSMQFVEDDTPKESVSAVQITASEVGEA